MMTNQSFRGAVQDYLAGGTRKQRVVTKYGDISNWDTSSVTDMSSLFQNATSFNQPLNKWNVSKVTSMNAMFYRAPSFNQPLNNWDVSMCPVPLTVRGINAPGFRVNYSLPCQNRHAEQGLRLNSALKLQGLRPGLASVLQHARSRSQRRRKSSPAAVILDRQ